MELTPLQQVLVLVPVQRQLEREQALEVAPVLPQPVRELALAQEQPLLSSSSQALVPGLVLEFPLFPPERWRLLESQAR